MKCPKCGNASIKGDVYCRNCNEKLLQISYICDCGKEVLTDIGVCYECGKKVEELDRRPKCGYCNTAVVEGEIFCSKCGKQLIP